MPAYYQRKKSKKMHKKALSQCFLVIFYTKWGICEN